MSFLSLISDPYLVLLIIVSSLFVIYYLRDRNINTQLDKHKPEIIKSLEERNKAFAATTALNDIILQTLDFSKLAQQIANAIPQFLGYQTGVLAIVDESRGVLRRVAISETSGGEAALKTLEIPFKNIEIDLNDKDNYCTLALQENRIKKTSHLYDVLRPVVSEQNSDWVQQQMGTKITLIYPIFSANKEPLGTFLVSMDKNEDQITEYEYQAINNFVNGVKIALVNAGLFTSLERTTRELKEANEKLKQLDKLKDDFVSIASHELRTPMTAIKSYLWMALKRAGIPLSEKMQKYLSRAYISTERLINLVNDMLNVSRIESGSIEINPKEFDIVTLADEAMQMFIPKAGEKNIKTEVIKGKIPTVFGDPDKITQVLLNLLGNALKFTPDGGTISISFFTDGKTVETSIKDSGVGISEGDLSRLFQKFGRLDNSYVAAATSGGTGLGLFISKSLVDLMGGKIWAKSEGQGKGTTFTFSLPIVTPEILANAEKYTKKSTGEVKSLEPVKI